MITCLVCQRQFSALTNTHLKTHKLTPASYVELYPGAETISNEAKDKASQLAKRNNAVRDYSTLGEKISATKQQRKAAGVDYGVGMRGRVVSDKTRQKLSDAKKGKPSPLKGKLVISSNTRAIISSSLRQYFAPIVAQRAEARAEQAGLIQDAALAKQADYELELKTCLMNKAISLIKTEHNSSSFKCLTCSTEWILTKQYLDKTRREKITCRTCAPKLTTSQGELELYSFIKTLCPDAVTGNRSVLGGRELDVLIESKKIAFEFNGLYWHSELNNPIQKHLLWKQQHAYKLGYRLYHIFEDEWLEKRALVEDRIKAILGKLRHKLHARKCVIIKLSAREKNEFLTANHLQGADVSGIRYGLMFDTKIVACMTFKPTSFVKGGDGNAFELSRFASLHDHNVRGAAGKLLKAFLHEHKPIKLISYADRRWSFGKLYEALGFKFDSMSTPSYWYMKAYKDRKHRSVFMKHKLVENGLDKSKTEWELMQESGYDRIWDCGTLKYVWQT